MVSKSIFLLISNYYLISYNFNHQLLVMQILYHNKLATTILIHFVYINKYFDTLEKNTKNVQKGQASMLAYQNFQYFLRNFNLKDIVQIL